MDENYIKLYNGVLIPKRGYGMWKLQNNSENEKAIEFAFKAGYRLFDTASHYGNEELLGRVIKNTNINRNELFITSKVWVDSRGYEETLNAFEESIKKLNVDYLNLYLIHWPASKTQYKNYKEINLGTWRALEKLYIEKKAKAIGVCNFTIEYLNDILNDCTIKPMINQIEFHPGYMQIDLFNFCLKNGIQVEAWSALGHGEILENEELKSIALKYSKDVASIILQWISQHGVISISKTINKDRMINNIKNNEFFITDEDMKQIDSLKFIGGLALEPDNFNY